MVIMGSTGLGAWEAGHTTNDLVACFIDVAAN
jgi:hypothetical protein